MSASAGSSLDQVALVLFDWHGRTFALPAADVTRLSPATAGVAPGLGALLGLAEAPPAAGDAPPRRLLRLHSGSGAACVQVEEPVRQVHLGAAALFPLPALLRAGCAERLVRALARWRADGSVRLVPVLDARRLCALLAETAAAAGAVREGD